MVSVLVLAFLLWRLNMHQSVLFRELDNAEAQTVNIIHLKRIKSVKSGLRVCVCMYVGNIC